LFQLCRLQGVPSWEGLYHGWRLRDLSRLCKEQAHVNPESSPLTQESGMKFLNFYKKPTLNSSIKSNSLTIPSFPASLEFTWQLSNSPHLTTTQMKYLIQWSLLYYFKRDKNLIHELPNCPESNYQPNQTIITNNKKCT